MEFFGWDELSMNDLKSGKWTHLPPKDTEIQSQDYCFGYLVRVNIFLQQAYLPNYKENRLWKFSADLHIPEMKHFQTDLFLQFCNQITRSFAVPL